jgi:5-aminolevulinate synthase
MNYQDLFTQNIENIKKEKRYRNFRVVDKDISTYPSVKIDKKFVKIWCSNDYLGMSKNESVIDKFISSATKNGVGSGGTRNISGTTEEINNLEKEIAEFHGKESALVFTSGYVSNLASISAIVKIIPEIIVFSDQKNHASIISGIKQNRAKYEIFEHNNINDLELKIQKYPENTPKIIIFEAIYSMDGSTPNILEIEKIAKKYNALTYIDEVHSVGMYGKNGRGISNLFNISHKIDIIQGTFGKSFGVIGGYICSSKEICDAIRLNGSAFIFTTSLPPAICAAISESVRVVGGSEGNILRTKHWRIVDFIKSQFLEKGVEFIDNKDLNTHIIPLMIRGAENCNNFSQKMQDKYSIYLQQINYPTVPIGQERMRITCSPLHTEKDAEYLVKSIVNEINI